MEMTVNEDVVIERNRIDRNQLRQYVEFLRRLEEAGVDVTSHFTIQRPLAEPTKLAWLTNRPIVHSQT
jgi:hypothetical protein